MRSVSLVVVAFVSALLGALVALTAPRVSAQALFTNPSQLRFRLVGDEFVASPDGRGTVAGWKVVVLRDMKSDQCYVAFMTGQTMSVNGPSVCP
jgi:hypothetical protein